MMNTSSSYLRTAMPHLWTRPEPCCMWDLASESRPRRTSLTAYLSPVVLFIQMDKSILPLATSCLLASFSFCLYTWYLSLSVGESLTWCVGIVKLEQYFFFVAFEINICLFCIILHWKWIAIFVCLDLYRTTHKYTILSTLLDSIQA